MASFSSPELQQLADLIDLLKSKGVVKAEIPGKISIEFGPTHGTHVQSDKAKKTDPEICSCGHPYTSHGPYGCLHDCGPEQCVPDEVLSKINKEFPSYAQIPGDEVGE